MSIRSIFIKIALALFLTAPIFAVDGMVSKNGNIVEVLSGGEYVMGDNDSKKDARQYALMQAKVSASEIAGTYIESNFEQIVDSSGKNISRHELKSFSASILQVQVLSDDFEMLTNKTTICKIQIKATIDLSVLQERIKQLGEDKTKKEKIVTLQDENKDLLERMQKLASQLRTLENIKAIKPEEIRVLRDERESLMAKFQSNESGAARLVLEKNSLADKYANAKSSKEQNTLNAIEAYRVNILKKLPQLYKISVNEIYPSDNGSFVSVYWSAKLPESASLFFSDGDGIEEVIRNIEKQSNFWWIYKPSAGWTTKSEVGLNYKITLFSKNDINEYANFSEIYNAVQSISKRLQMKVSILPLGKSKYYPVISCEQRGGINHLGECTEESADGVNGYYFMQKSDDRFQGGKFYRTDFRISPSELSQISSAEVRIVDCGVESCR
jgi:hypothetical protein